MGSIPGSSMHGWLCASMSLSRAGGFIPSAILVQVCTLVYRGIHWAQVQEKKKKSGGSPEHPIGTVYPPGPFDARLSFFTCSMTLKRKATSHNM